MSPQRQHIKGCLRNVSRLTAYWKYLKGQKGQFHEMDTFLKVSTFLSELSEYVLMVLKVFTTLKK